MMPVLVLIFSLGGSTVALNEFAQYTHSAATCKLALRMSSSNKLAKLH